MIKLNESESEGSKGLMKFQYASEKEDSQRENINKSKGKGEIQQIIMEDVN